MTHPLAGSTAIVGIGQTEFSKAAGRSETQLASEAIVAALADAGLSTGDVDGLVSYTIDPVEETELARALGLDDIGFSSRVPYGGGGSQGVLGDVLNEKLVFDIEQDGGVWLAQHGDSGTRRLARPRPLRQRRDGCE